MHNCKRVTWGSYDPDPPRDDGEDDNYGGF